MMKVSRYLMGIGVALCMTGCVKVTVPEPVVHPVQPVQPVQQAPQQTQTPVTPLRGNDALGTTTELPTVETRIVNVLEDKPRVYFTAMPTSDANEKTFCSKLIFECVQRMLPKNVRVVSESKADMIVKIGCEFKEVSTFGEYVKMDCKAVTAGVVGIREEELSSLMIVHPRSMERKLGRDEAMNQYVMPVCNELLPQLRSEIERLASENIAVEEIIFLVKCAPSGNATDEFRREVQRIKGQLDGTDGILSWDMLKQDAENQRCSFRVVYMRKKYPEGLGNKLGSKLADMPRSK